MHDSPTSRDKRDKNVTFVEISYSKINGGCKWGKIKILAAQSSRYGKYLDFCADKKIILGKMRAPLFFSLVEYIMYYSHHHPIGSFTVGIFGPFFGHF